MRFSKFFGQEVSVSVLDCLCGCAFSTVMLAGVALQINTPKAWFLVAVGSISALLAFGILVLPTLYTRRLLRRLSELRPDHPSPQ